MSPENLQALADLMNSLVCAAQLRGEYKARGQRDLELDWADRVSQREREINQKFGIPIYTESSPKQEKGIR